VTVGVTLVDFVGRKTGAIWIVCAGYFQRFVWTRGQLNLGSSRPERSIAGPGCARPGRRQRRTVRPKTTALRPPIPGAPRCLEQHPEWDNNDSGRAGCVSSSRTRRISSDGPDTDVAQVDGNPQRL